MTQIVILTADFCQRAGIWRDPADVFGYRNGTLVSPSAENKAHSEGQVGTKVTSGFGEASAIIEFD